MTNTLDWFQLEIQTHFHPVLPQTSQKFGSVTNHRCKVISRFLGPVRCLFGESSIRWLFGEILLFDSTIHFVIAFNSRIGLVIGLVIGLGIGPGMGPKIGPKIDPIETDKYLKRPRIDPKHDSNFKLIQRIM